MCLFAPVGIVRNLIESGQPMTPGMEQRFITIFFCDIEGFTTIAEQLQPVELSEQVSRYFDTITAAVADTLGRDADTVLPCSPKPTPIFTPNEPQMERVCLGCRPPSQFLSGKME